MKTVFAAMVAICMACAAANADQPTFGCGLIGDSGYRITYTNPYKGDDSKAWMCTVSCVIRTGDGGFTEKICTDRIPLTGDDTREMCREVGVSGGPFSSPTISNSSCS